MNDTIKFTRRYAKRGDSMTITIPTELGQWLNIQEGDNLTLTGYTGKHGKYIAIWKETKWKKTTQQ